MKVYFPGLNGLRAISALIVVFFHVNLMMVHTGAAPIRYIKEREELASHAVILFFVLSGYLVTFLLMKEQRDRGDIDVRKFYIRRILRIWPIYYAAILLSIVLIPVITVLAGLDITYCLQTIGLYSVLVSNLAMFAGYIIPTIGPLWSIGVEEQFYLAWPVILRQSTNVLNVLLLFVFGYVSLKLMFYHAGEAYHMYAMCMNVFSFDAFAIGGAAAVLNIHNGTILRFLYHPAVQVVCWLFLIYSCVIIPVNTHFMINKEIYALVFAVVILNVSSNPSTLVRINNRWYNYLGKISYGIYVWHPFAILLACLVIRYFFAGVFSSVMQFVLMCIFVFPATLLAAHLSYRYLEARFLEMKKKFVPTPEELGAAIPSNEAALLDKPVTQVSPNNH